MTDDQRKVDIRRDHYAIGLVLTGGFFLILHLTFVAFKSDDAYFIVLRNSWDSLLDLIIDRYLTDSSRVLSETMLFFLIDKPFILWQLLDTLICLLIYHAGTVILVGDRYSTKNYLVLLFFAVYPYMHMGSAGWICTSLNYIWPMAMLLYAISGSVRRLRGEVIPGWRYILYIPAMIFAANCEQSAACLFFGFGLLVFYRLQDMRWKPGKAVYEILGCLIGIGGIVFALTSPGNGARTAMEAANWMPEFFDLTIFDKFRLCAVFVFEHFVQIPDVTFFLFSLLLAMSIWSKKEEYKAFDKIVALLPLAVDVIFTAVWFVPVFLIEHRRDYNFTTPSIYMETPFIAFVQLSQLLGLGIYMAATVYILWIRKDTFRVRLAMIWALGCGFAVRMALMLSPTMFASWHRTLIFLYFAFLGDALILYGDVKNKKWRSFVWVILGVGIMVNLILTVGHQLRLMGVNL